MMLKWPDVLNLAKIGNPAQIVKSSKRTRSGASNSPPRNIK
jgi:hypothetical protein